MAKVTFPPSLRAGLLGLVLASLLLGAASAQVLDPTVSLTLSETALSLGAGNATEVTGTVTNNGNLQGTVTLALSIPAEWNVTLDPDSAFTLAAGASVEFTLAIAAPGPGLGESGTELLVTATIQDGANRQGIAEQSLTLTRVDPPVPPPPPPPYGLYATMAAIAAGLVLAALVLYLRARNQRLARERAAAEEARRKAEHEAYLARETGIGISLLEGPTKFGTRRELVFRVAIENQTPREREAVVGVAQGAEGWTAAAAIPKARLGPSERLVVTFYANPGDVVPGGAKATFAFFAKPAEAQELDQRVTVEVVAPEVRIPEMGERPVSAPREAVAPRPVLRF